VFELKLVSCILSVTLYNLFLSILFSLLLENCLQQVLAASFVHPQYTRCDNVIDLALGHVVKKAPVTVVGVLLRQRLLCVLLDALEPLSLHQVLEQLGVCVFKSLDL